MTTTSICMHAETGTHGVLKEIKEVFFTIIIIILLYTIFLEFYAPFIFDFSYFFCLQMFQHFPSPPTYR